MTTNVMTAKIIDGSLRDHLHVLEHLWRQVDAGGGQPIAGLRPDTGCTEAPDHAAVLTNAGSLEVEKILHRDGVLFHADDLGNGGYLSGAVRESRYLDDEVDRRGNLLAYRFL